MGNEKEILMVLKSIRFFLAMILAVIMIALGLMLGGDIAWQLQQLLVGVFVWGGVILFLVSFLGFLIGLGDPVSMKGDENNSKDEK